MQNKQVHASGTFKEQLDFDSLALQGFPVSQSQTKSENLGKRL